MDSEPHGEPRARKALRIRVECAGERLRSITEDFTEKDQARVDAVVGTWLDAVYAARLAYIDHLDELSKSKRNAELDALAEHHRDAALVAGLVHARSLATHDRVMLVHAKTLWPTSWPEDWPSPSWVWQESNNADDTRSHYQQHLAGRRVGACTERAIHALSEIIPRYFGESDMSGVQRAN